MIGGTSRFICIDQDILWAFFIGFAVVLGIIAVGKLVVSQRKKTELLKRIDKKVDRINSAVGEIQDEAQASARDRADRKIRETAAEAATEAARAVVNSAVLAPPGPVAPSATTAPAATTTPSVSPIIAVGPEPEEKAEEPEAEKVQAAGEEHIRTEASASPGLSASPERRYKFDSLDFATSRNGKSYTIEELEDQIK